MCVVIFQILMQQPFRADFLLDRGTLFISSAVADWSTSIDLDSSKSEYDMTLVDKSVSVPVAAELTLYVLPFLAEAMRSLVVLFAK